MAKYVICAQSGEHTSDVRGCCFNPTTNQLITTSRDRTAKVWNINNNNIAATVTVYDHEHWVNAAIMLPDGKSFVTGCHDSNIRVFELSPTSATMKQSLGGHRSSVTSLSILSGARTGSVDDYLLISGSWDGTARIWDVDQGKSLCELPDHENAVCVLGLGNGIVATGSAGVQTANNTVEGFQIRLWDVKSILNGTGSVNPIKTLKGEHTGSIRSLCSLPSGNGFASCSNDGSVVVWTLAGDMTMKFQNPAGFEGLPAFNFSISSAQLSIGSRKVDAILCACNDNCLRVWDIQSGNLIQEIGHPSSVWCACVVSNGDIATGCSDGMVRLFTQDASRAASAEDQMVYETSITAAINAIKNKQSGGGNGQVEASKLEKIEFARPGTSDGQVKMFNRQGVAWVYQWMDASTTWVEVGEVMGGDGGIGSGREEIDGVFYDKVLPVEIEDTVHGTGLRKLKLGFNNTDNPFQVANEFVEKHDVPREYVLQIAQYITNNRTSAPSLQAMTGDVSRPSQGAMDIDHSSSVSGKKKLRNFPLHDARGMCFDKLDKTDVSNMQSKINEFNAKSSSPMDQNQQKLLGEVFATLQSTSRYHATSFSKPQIDTVHFLLTKWEDEFIFPIFDLVRALLIHPDSSPSFVVRFKKDIVDTIQSRILKPGASMPTQLLGTRILVNMFRFDAGAEVIMQAGSLNIDGLSSALAHHANKNVRNAFATLLLNVVNYQQFKGKADDAVSGQCAASLITLLAEESASVQSDPKKFTPDTFLRVILGIGIIAMAGKTNDTARKAAEESAPLIQKFQPHMATIAPAGGKLEETVKEFLSLIA